jgi:hypothetical protein
MKTHHVLIGVAAVATAAIAIENFYEHPTYGRGLQAFVSVVGAWMSL